MANRSAKMERELDTLQLLRERSVVEVRDHDLEVSAQAAKLYDDFTQELRSHYGEILEVTDDVNGLYDKLREVDTNFRDLCFKDDLYKLRKMDLVEDSVTPGLPDTPNIDTTESRKILLVSNWSLAISDFLSRFAISSASAKLFREVITQFANLQQALPGLQEYRAVIASKCQEFLQYIVSSPENNVSFHISQWAHIYYLVLAGPQELPWDAATVRQVEDVLFESVFEEPLGDLLKCSDDIVTKFVHSTDFEKKSREKILRDIEMEFSRLEELLSQPTDDTPTLTYPASVHELDVASVIENCRLHAMGLTTATKVNMYKIVKPLISMMGKFRESEGTSDRVEDLRNRLTEILEKHHPVMHQESAAIEAQTMDELVGRIITQQNDHNASELIRSQISALQVL
ncbi:COG1 (YGL223C) [Zygosaccharomyces parabailii]|nr:COG1 (YGL223C) [Zygosaccharomyces parabailii]CDH11845.1 uncharacterized protein ZBAI_03631 [Zygosaccharomyces bailii ISA1307]